MLYYFDEGKLIQDTLFVDNDNTYLALEDGAIAFGWIQDEDEWRFFDYNTGIQQLNTWIADGKDASGNGLWYLLDEKGILKVSQWHCSAKDVWYYLGANGAMVRDQMIGQYYVDADGVWQK